ncbi:DUF58 domain-containing protein [Candidatus Woesearchaeota archaeon]|nr:DUF58 domain-containing protein [Candidatus Woesearchaeota archaeon]
MIDTTFLEGLNRFNLIVRKRVTSSYSGPRRSIAQGRGIIFKDHRIYAPGDDFRGIDWRVFARTDNLMIKNYEEEKNLVAHIIVDKSASMGFGKKFDYASMLGVGFAYLALKNNDKFQFSTFAEDLEVYQPKRGMSQLVSMIDYLNKIKQEGKTRILDIAQKYKRFIGSRALIIIISDFLMPIEEIREALYYFSGHEVRLIQVLDAMEKRPEMEGDFKLQDAESKENLRVYFSLKSRSDYTQRMDSHFTTLKHEAEVLGMDFFQISTDMSIFDAFYSVLR